MLCPNCEAENRDDARFCDECGFPLSGSIARMAGSASPVEAVSPRRQAEQAVAEDHPFEEATPAVPFESEPETPAEPEAGHEVPEPPAESARAAGLSEPAFDDWPDDEPQAKADAGTEPSGPASAPAAEDPYAGYYQSSDDGFAYEPSYSAPPSEFTMQMPRVEPAPRTGSRDFRIAGPDRGNGRMRTIAVIAAAVVAGIVIAAAVTFALGLWGGVAVPDVTGRTEADARAALEEAGFTVRSSQVKSDDTEGLVIITDPEAGARAGEGSEVVIHIATARFVPDIVGKNADEAAKLLEESGYENVRYEKEKSEGEENVVTAVTPDAGTRAKSNAEIVVKVTEPYSVPDISGLDLATAEQKIMDDGLTYGVTYVDTDQYEDGTILGTTPEAGAKVEKDSYVSISVARRRGAELVGLTESMFAAGQTVDIGGVDYQVESLDAVEYLGDDTVSFTVTALPTTTFFGKTIYADEQVVSGQVLWSEDNEVISVS